jgi:hypothetical protein
MEMALEFYKKKVADLERELQNTKTFLNMVIHDLRNPINNINYGLDSGINAISKAESLLNEYEQDFMNDILVLKNLKVFDHEVNNFEEDMINEFNQNHGSLSHQASNNQVDEVISHRNINSIPITDPKSSKEAFMKNKPNDVNEEEKEEPNQDDSQRRVSQSVSVRNRMNLLSD